MYNKEDFIKMLGFMLKYARKHTIEETFKEYYITFSYLYDESKELYNKEEWKRERETGDTFLSKQRRLI